MTRTTLKKKKFHDLKILFHMSLIFFFQKYILIFFEIKKKMYMFLMREKSKVYFLKIVKIKKKITCPR